MTGREIVQRTLDYSGPERVARSFPQSDLLETRFTTKTRATEWREVGGGRWECHDEWGNLWARVDATSMGEVVKGVLSSPADVDRYEFPDFSNPADYDAVRRRRAEKPDKWLIGRLPGFTFNIARKFFKIDNYLMELALDRAALAPLHDRIDGVLLDMIANYAAAGADCVMFPEDWGTQNALMINPALWRDEFFPRFARLCAAAHGAGVKVFMHSCGRIGAIVPSLMEAGIDLLQFDQPTLHGIDNLAAHQERGRITFWCPVDIQRTLQSRDESRIRAEAREMLDKLWRGRGGFVAGYYEDNASIGLEPHWQAVASDEFTRRGVRSAYA